MKDIPKCDRALKLHEDGISHEAIALRLGIRQHEVCNYIKTGKRRRRDVVSVERALWKARLDSRGNGND